MSKATHNKPIKRRLQSNVRMIEPVRLAAPLMRIIILLGLGVAVGI